MSDEIVVRLGQVPPTPPGPPPLPKKKPMQKKPSTLAVGESISTTAKGQTHTFTMRQTPEGGKELLHSSPNVKPGAISPEQADQWYDEMAGAAWMEALGEEPEPPPPPEEVDYPGIAEEWRGDMVRIGPEFYMQKDTLDHLSALSAVGFDMSTPQTIQGTIFSFMTDPKPLLEELDLNQQEWAGLIQYLSSANTLQAKLAADTSESIKLMLALGDLGIMPSVANSKTKKAIEALANGSGPFAAVAKELSTYRTDPEKLEALLKSLNLDPDIHKPEVQKAVQQMAKSSSGNLSAKANEILALSAGIFLDDAVRAQLGEELEEGLPVVKNPSRFTTGPLIGPDGKIVMIDQQMMEKGDDDLSKAKTKRMPAPTNYVVDDRNPTPWKDNLSPAERNLMPEMPSYKDDDGPSLAVPTPKKLEELTETASGSFLVPVQPMPPTDMRPGAQSKAKATQEFVNTYDERAYRIPGVFSVDYGEKIEGIKVFAETKVGDGPTPTISVKGGDMVVWDADAGGRQEAMVIGRDQQGLLACRLLPYGQVEKVNVVENKVRWSAVQKKQKFDL